MEKNLEDKAGPIIYAHRLRVWVYQGAPGSCG